MTFRALPFPSAPAFAVALALAGACASEGSPPTGTADVAVQDTASTVDTVSGEPDVVTPSDNVISVTPPDSWVTDLLRVPRNIHLTWQSEPGTSVVASWATSDLDLASYAPKLWIVPKSVVDAHGGAMPYADAYVVEGWGLKYKETLLGRDLNDDQYVVFHAEMLGLQPTTEYVYRVGTWDAFDEVTGTFENPQLSEPRTYRTPRKPGDRGEFRVVLAGDSRNGYDGIEANMPHYVTLGADAWFFNGDMNQDGFQEQWDTWMTVMERLISRTPLMPVQGNHEIFATVYYDQFTLPAHEELPADWVEHAWTIKLGNAQFVGLDSNTDASVQEVKPWLDATLAAAAADPDVDWLFVMSHHSTYSASKHGSTPRMQEHWAPLFEAHGVDVAFAGHDHNYERSHPVRAGAVAQDGGVVYVVAGAFFAPPYDNGTEWWTAVSHPGDKANFMVVDFDGASVKFTAYSGDGAEVLDEFTLSK